MQQRTTVYNEALAQLVECLLKSGSESEAITTRLMVNSRNFVDLFSKSIAENNFTRSTARPMESGSLYAILEYYTRVKSDWKEIHKELSLDIEAVAEEFLRLLTENVFMEGWSVNIGINVGPLIVLMLKMNTKEIFNLVMNIFLFCIKDATRYPSLLITLLGALSQYPAAMEHINKSDIERTVRKLKWMNKDQVDHRHIAESYFEFLHNMVRTANMKPDIIQTVFEESTIVIGYLIKERASSENGNLVRNCIKCLLECTQKDDQLYGEQIRIILKEIVELPESVDPALQVASLDALIALDERKGDVSSVEYLKELFTRTVSSVYTPGGKNKRRATSTEKNILIDKIMESLSSLIGIAFRIGKEDAARSLVYYFSNKLALYSTENDLLAVDGNPVNSPAHNVIKYLGEFACKCADLLDTGGKDRNTTLILLIEHITVIFISRLTSTVPDPLGPQIVNILSDVASRSAKIDIVSEIMNLFVSILRNPYSAENSTSFRDVPKALRKVATKVVEVGSEDLRYDILVRVQNLFTEVALEEQGKGKKLEDVGEVATNRLVDLLPVINILSKSNSSEKMLYPSRGVAKRYRNIWFYLIVFQLVKRPHMHRLIRMIKKFATNTPVLISNGRKDEERGGEIYDLIEMEQDFAAFLRQGVSGQDLAEMRKWLVQLMPRREANIRQMYNYECVYILCVYYCETFRASSNGEFGHCFAYLGDETGIKSEVSGCINTVVGIVFDNFLTFVEDLIRSDDTAGQTKLELSTQSLLVFFCSRVNKIRVAADKFILRLLEKFPQVMFGQKCLSMLLELLDVVSAACNAEAVLKPEALSVSLPSHNEIFYLPETLSDRQVLLNDIRKLAYNWMTVGAKKAPLYSHALLQSYIFENGFTNFKHSSMLARNSEGRSLAIQIGSMFHSSGNYYGANRSTLMDMTGVDSISSLRLDGNSINTDNAAYLSHEFITSLQEKRYWTGALREMLRLRIRSSEDSVFETVAQAIKEEFVEIRGNLECGDDCREDQLKDSLISNLSSCLMKVGSYFYNKESMSSEFLKAGNGRNGTHSDVEFSDDSEVCHQGYPIDLEAELLHEVVWVPVALFYTEEAVNIARIVWTWIISSSETSAGVKLMSELREVWSWCIKNGVGLFSGGIQPTAGNYNQAISNRSSVAATTGEKERQQTVGRQKERRRNHIPHLRIIEFLKERIEVTSDTSKIEEQDLITSMVFPALSDASLLSLRPASLSARFQLLCLGLKLLSRFKGKFTHTKSLFYRIFSAALLWFSTPSRVYVQTQLNESNADLGSLIAFYSELRTFQKANKIYSIMNLRTRQDKKHRRSPSKGPSMSRERSLLRSQSHIEIHDRNLKTTLEVMFNAQDVVNIDNPKQQTMRKTNESALGGNIQNMTQEDILLDLDPDLYLLNILILYEIDHISVWTDPTGAEPEIVKNSMYISNLKKKNWEVLTKAAWWHSPDVAINLPTRFRSGESSRIISNKLEELVLGETLKVVHIPEAVRYLITEKNVEKNIPELKYLLYWESGDILQVLRYFANPIFSRNPFVALYVTNSLRKVPADTVWLYLPQLVQAMRFDSGDFIKNYLRDAAKTSDKVCHLMLSNLTVEGEQTTTRLDNDPLPAILIDLRKLIVEEMDDKRKEAYQRQFSFFDSVTEISGLLKSFPPEERKDQISKELMKIEVTDSLYLPTIPNLKVVGINYDNPTPLQSHAKVPIKCSFKCRKADDVAGTEFEESVIFKVDDDTRQDALALQCIRLLRDILESNDMNLFLCPYQVIPTKPGCGIIEVVKNAKSRDQLGKATDGSLYEYFLQRFGDKSSISFQNARRKFIQSMAAYSVASFLLQIKDRHNGNIMVDEEGHVVHIDFGFIFDLSPGGDIKFETAPFKLTKEMIQIMGGNIESEQFQWFLKYCCLAYLAARKQMDEFISLVELMVDTNLPCFKPRTLQNLRNRFTPDKSERQAAQYMVAKIRESFEKFTTLIYDKFQAWQNGIEY